MLSLSNAEKNAGQRKSPGYAETWPGLVIIGIAFLSIRG